MPSMEPIKLLDAVQGVNLVKIEAALKVLGGPAFDLSHFTVRLVRGRTSEFVILSEKPGDPSAGRNHGVRVGATGRLSAQELATVLADLPHSKVLDQVQGDHLRAMREAEREFRSRIPKPDIAQYNLELVRDGATLIVIFSHKDRLPGSRGNIPGRPGLEVELDPADFHVRRSSFIR